MNVLYITQFSPWNPKYGAALRSLGIILGLSQNHSLQIALASRDPTQRANFQKGTMAGFVPLHVFNPSVSSRPFVTNNPFRMDFLHLIEEERPDVVWYFTKYALREVGFPINLPSVLDMDDLPWRKLWLLGKYQSGRRKLLTLSKVIPSWIEDSKVIRQASMVLMTNPEEVHWIRTRRPVVTLANGFNFQEEILVYPRTQKRVVFFGSLFYYPNLDGINWFCREVWPRLRAAVPEARLDVVGLYQEGVEVLRETEGVTLHGFVDDLDPIIQESDFLIVPLRIGSGTRIKILEAWSKGLPVISTTLGAEGLGAQTGEHILIGDSAYEFSEACIQLLRSPETGACLARNAFHFARERFSWSAIYPKLDQVLDSALKFEG